MIATSGQPLQSGSATQSAPLVAVNQEQCRRLAALIGSQTIPQDREDSSLPGFSQEAAGNFYFLLVAICHQTSPVGKPPLEGYIDGRLVRGWDYLTARLEAAVRADPALLVPSTWSKVGPDQLAQIFRDERLGERLSGVAHRAELIRNLGDVLFRDNRDGVQRLYESAGGRIAGALPNLLTLLAAFRAYDDPVCKKSYFFLALMRNAGFWKFADPENLGPPVDYHEVRGHLRIGTVQIQDPQLEAKLLAGQEVTSSEDIAIRKAVHDAIMLVSDATGLRNPSRLHYLFWNVFRSCCTREAPHCHACPPGCKLPERYVPLAMHADGVRRCPFSDVCLSADKQVRLIEHRFETDYY